VLENVQKSFKLALVVEVFVNFSVAISVEKLEVALIQALALSFSG